MKKDPMRNGITTSRISNTIVYGDKPPTLIKTARNAELVSLGLHAWWSRKASVSFKQRFYKASVYIMMVLVKQHKSSGCLHQRKNKLKLRLYD